MRLLHIYFIVFVALFLSACKKDNAIKEDYKTPGTSANHIHSASIYSSLQIEISYLPGYAPDT